MKRGRKKLNITIEKLCENCGDKLILKNNRDIKQKRFCSRFCNAQSISNKNWKNEEYRKNQIEHLKSFSKDVNIKKGHPGKLHPKWIDDRAKLKCKRCQSEERQFYKIVLKERNYTCELTGEHGNKLSVHHMDSVHLFPEKCFDKNNVIVIKKEIHLDFHKKYGYSYSTNDKWNKYLLENNYVK